MLRVKAEIIFTIEGKNYKNGKHPLSPAFRFADGLAFSGDIKSEYPEYVYNQKYIVDIEFFTINSEAYEAIKPLIKKGMNLTISTARSILGLSKVLDFDYVEDAAA